MILETRDLEILDAVHPKLGKPLAHSIGGLGYEPKTFVPILQ